MSDTNFDFKNIIQSIYESVLADNIDAQLVEKMVKSFSDAPYDFSNPDIFYTMFGFKVEMLFEEILKNFLKQNPDIKDTFKPQFIFMHYGYFTSNIEKLVTKRKGSTSCIADVSRFIMKMYLDYALTGEIPETDLEEHYWNPRFGMNEDWIAFCDGLYKLYYGSPEEYLKSYAKLLNAEYRTYLHIFHTTYLVLKDGNKIIGSQAYDKKAVVEQKDGCYHISKFVCGEQPYDSIKDMFGHTVYTIPISDVDFEEEINESIWL